MNARNYRVKVWAAAALMVATQSAYAAAATFPTRPLTLIIPTAPGGANDAMGRILAKGMEAELGQSVIVLNRAGGNGSIAADYVARSDADGYTLMFGYIATHGINPALQKLSYDPVADFTPIGMIATSQTVLVVNNEVPASNAQGLVDLLKSKPDTMNFASGGMGTSPHLAGELFKQSTGVDMLHVSYKGSAPAILDTVGGRTHMMFASLFTAYPYIQQGKLKAFGIAGADRAKAAPDIPTLDEQGIKDVHMTQWYALFAPAGIPEDVQKKLNQALNTALNDPQARKMIESQGAEVQTGTPEELLQRVKSESSRWKELVQAIGLKIN